LGLRKHNVTVCNKFVIQDIVDRGYPFACSIVVLFKSFAVFAGFETFAAFELLELLGHVTVELQTISRAVGELGDLQRRRMSSQENIFADFGPTAVEAAEFLTRTKHFKH